MAEEQLILSIKSGCFRDRGTIRKRRVTASNGTNAFAPVVLNEMRVNDLEVMRARRQRMAAQPISNGSGAPEPF